MLQTEHIENNANRGREIQHIYYSTYGIREGYSKKRATVVNQDISMKPIWAINKIMDTFHIPPSR